MNNRILQGFIAGCLGAIILTALMYVLKAAGMGEPGFVAMYEGKFGPNPPGGQFMAALLFIISGGIWGIVFALMIKKSTVLKGFLFGLLPSLWLLVVVNYALDKPLFNDFKPMGIIMPLIFNMGIWGSFIGWYMSKRNKRRVNY
ncbi:MAG: hypothetical protein ABIN25_02950 [Ginsengibacter sp.]